MEASSSQQIVLGATDRLTTALDLGVSHAPISMRAWLKRRQPLLLLTALPRCIADFDPVASSNCAVKTTWFAPSKER